MNPEERRLRAWVRSLLQRAAFRASAAAAAINSPEAETIAGLTALSEGPLRLVERRTDERPGVWRLRAVSRDEARALVRRLEALELRAVERLRAAGERVMRRLDSEAVEPWPELAWRVRLVGLAGDSGDREEAERIVDVLRIAPYRRPDLASRQMTIIGGLVGMELDRIEPLLSRLQAAAHTDAVAPRPQWWEASGLGPVASGDLLVLHTAGALTIVPLYQRSRSLAGAVHELAGAKPIALMAGEAKGLEIDGIVALEHIPSDRLERLGGTKVIAGPSAPAADQQHAMRALHAAIGRCLRRPQTIREDRGHQERDIGEYVTETRATTIADVLADTLAAEPFRDAADWTQVTVSFTGRLLLTRSTRRLLPESMVDVLVGWRSFPGLSPATDMVWQFNGSSIPDEVVDDRRLG